MITNFTQSLAVHLSVGTTRNLHLSQLSSSAFRQHHCDCFLRSYVQFSRTQFVHKHANCIKLSQHVLCTTVVVDSDGQNRKRMQKRNLWQHVFFDSILPKSQPQTVKGNAQGARARKSQEIRSVVAASALERSRSLDKDIAWQSLWRP